MAIKTIGVLTSGGDAPGMNAALRSVTRTAIFNQLNVKAIHHGYKGLLTNDIEDFKTENLNYYRAKKIPASGCFLKEQQTTLFDL